MANTLLSAGLTGVVPSGRFLETSLLTSTGRKALIGQRHVFMWAHTSAERPERTTFLSWTSQKDTERGALIAGLSQESQLWLVSSRISQISQISQFRLS